MPKSGSHLIMNLFFNFGIQKSKNHNFGAYYRDLDILDLNINDNEFGIGHTIYCKNFEEQLKDFKKVLLIRDIEEIYESNLRRISDGKSPMHSLIYKPKLLEIKKWEETNDIFVITFKDLIEKNIDKIDLLQKHLFGYTKYDSKDITEISLKQNSDTKSSIRE